MKKIIISLILITSFPMLFGAMPAVKILPGMFLKPLCFNDLASCSMAERILNLPSFGNFQVSSKCRPANQADAQRGICYTFRQVLEVKAIIDLPFLQQAQMRNQCHRNINECNFAKQIWSQLEHPMGFFMFNAICTQPNRSHWKMDDRTMDQLGIFICTPQNGPMELRVQAVRIK